MPLCWIMLPIRLQDQPRSGNVLAKEPEPRQGGHPGITLLQCVCVSMTHWSEPIQSELFGTNGWSSQPTGNCRSVGFKEEGTKSSGQSSMLRV